MSYTEMGTPTGFGLELRPDGLYVRFTCPRCDGWRLEPVNVIDLSVYGEYAVRCGDPRCTARPSRPGYELCLRLRVESRMLGMHDQPLLEAK